MNAASAPSSARLAEAIDRYHDVLTAYVDRGGEDHLALQGRMVQRGAVFAGRPLCTFLRPQLLLRSQQELNDRVKRRSPYLFRGETRGVLTRLSATSDCTLNNVHAGAGTVPTFILEDTPSAG